MDQSLISIHRFLLIQYLLGPLGFSLASLAKAQLDKVDLD